MREQLYVGGRRQGCQGALCPHHGGGAGQGGKPAGKGQALHQGGRRCCRQEYATGIYTSGVVFEPRFYEGFAT